MVPSGPPTPVGGGQPVNPSLLRSNSGLLVAQPGSLSTQPSFSSLVSPRNQYGGGGGGMNMVGNMANVSSLLNQSFANGGHSGISPSGGLQRGAMDMGGGSELDPLSGVANGFNPSFAQPSAGNPSSSVQTQHFQNPSGAQMGMDQHQPQQQQQLDSQSFLPGQQSVQQFSRPQHQHHHHQQQHQQQQQQQQPQYQSLRGGLGNMGAVKLEPQMSNEQNGPLRNLGPVKLEPQQLQFLRALGPVKLEPHSSDQSMLPQQQQQQQLLNMSRQPPQAAAAQMSILHQNRLLLQQPHLLKNHPQQRPPLSQQLQQQNLPVRAVPKQGYEPGTCARRLTLYMYHQQRRPSDNNIEFWRKFVAEYFAPHAKKRWCVSMYGSGRQTTGVFPQDIWHCEICNRKPGRGFETTVEVLPRLCKIKYDSGTLEELLYVDMPHEYQNATGQIVLDYAKAIQESVFEHLRVVREGQLRIVFSSDLKICSWEFCARRHEELIPRRLIIPQVSQLGAVAQKYQSASQNASSNLSVQDLQNNCNMFVSSARQLAKALEVPLVNDLGYTKRYVRCLQISEVVNSMKDLIDYSRETGSGPMASLVNFPRRTAAASGLHAQGPPTEEQQTMARNNSSSDQNTVSATVQLGSSNGVVTMNNTSLSTTHSTSSATTTAVTGLLHQNALNTQETAINSANSPYGGQGNTVQIPSAGSSTSHPQPHQANPSSPFPSPTPSSTNNQQPSAAVSSPANISMQQPSQPNEVDPSDSQNAVQQMLQEIMMTSQLTGGNNMVGVGSLGSEIKGLNGTVQPGSTVLNGGPCMVGNGINGNLGMGGAGFGNMGGAGAVGMMGGIRSSMTTNNPMSLNGRVGMGSMAQAPNINYQNQDVGNRLLGSLGSVNSFNNLQFD